MKKAIIIGPISNFGGREIEVNILLKSLKDSYDVSILSTSNIYKESFALQDLEFTKWNSLDRILQRKNKIVKAISIFSKFFNKGEKHSSEYVNNSLIKRFVNLDDLYFSLIKQELHEIDFVILCVQLTSKFLPEIVNYCHNNKIPCIIRTTGTIGQIPISNFSFLKRVTLFIHHSEVNAEKLNQQIALPYKVIDQCAMEEEALLSLEIKNNKPLQFGYLGRLSEEKGIIPLVDFFVNSDYPFMIAGDGLQKEAVLSKIKESKNCSYVGLINSNEVATFFNLIDVLIIPSYEESGPLVCLEAMAAGKIIISTDVGAVKERLQYLNTTYWFDIYNTATLRPILEELTNFSAMQLIQIKKEVRKRYEDKYTMHQIAVQYRNCIAQVLTKN